MSSTMQIAMIFIRLRFLLKSVTKIKEQISEGAPKAKLIKAIIGGVFVGFICGFVCVGGGMMMLFVLISFLGYQMHMAVETSVFIMTFTALTGGISHFAIGGMPQAIPDFTRGQWHLREPKDVVEMPKIELKKDDIKNEFGYSRK